MEDDDDVLIVESKSSVPPPKKEVKREESSRSPVPKSRKLEHGQSPSEAAAAAGSRVKTEVKKDCKGSVKREATPSDTGLFFDRRCLFHFGTQDEPECPERYEACVDLLLSKGVDKRCFCIQPRLASDEEILLAHDDRLMQELKAIKARLEKDHNETRVSTDIQESIYENEYTLDSVRRSVAASIDMSRRVFDGELKNGFCLIRPPGHHCDRSRRFGFCHANNVAIAAKYLMKHRHAKRIAVLDWDVHHGNGTQDIFHDEKEVLFISIHQEYADENDKMFPATGEVSDIGDRSARGFTMNLPIPVGCGDQEYQAMLDDVIMPALEEFDPEMLLISAGFDSADGDPLGSLEVSPGMFGYMTRVLMDKLNGKVVLFLEGGYNPRVVANCVLNCTQALLGDDVIPAPARSTEYDFIFHHLDKFVLTHRKYWSRIDQNFLPSDHMKRPSKKSKTKKRFQLYRRRKAEKRQRRQIEREKERAERHAARRSKHGHSSHHKHHHKHASKSGSNHERSKRDEDEEVPQPDSDDSDEEMLGDGDELVADIDVDGDEEMNGDDGSPPSLPLQKPSKKHHKKDGKHSHSHHHSHDKDKGGDSSKPKKGGRKWKRHNSSDEEEYTLDDDISQYHKKKKKKSSGSRGNSRASSPRTNVAVDGSDAVVVKRKRGRPPKNANVSTLNGDAHRSLPVSCNPPSTPSLPSGTGPQSTSLSNGASLVKKSGSIGSKGSNNKAKKTKNGGSKRSGNLHGHIAAMAAAAAAAPMRDDGDEVSISRTATSSDKGNHPQHVLLVE